MEPLQILLIVLVIAAIWAVVELALTIRRARSSVDTIDKTVDEVNEMLAETRPVVSKLDGVIDDLQPAITQVEPLLKSANVAVDALTSNLVEVEAVVRDVSTVTGAAASAGNAVSGAADSASAAVQRLFGKFKPNGGDTERALTESDEAAAAPEPASTDELDADHGAAAVPPRYYTYDADDARAASDASSDHDPSTEGDISND